MNATAIAITALLYQDGAFKNLVRQEHADDITRDVEALLNRYHRTLSNHLRNAVRVPGDDSGEKDYPSRETLRADDPLLPVPSPDQTETSEESKTSIPDYSQYQDNVRVLEASGAALFDDTAEHGEKVQSMKSAIAALNDLSAMLKSM